MSKLSKAFKKATKSVKKAVNSAGDDLASAAETVSSGTTDLFKDAEKNLSGLIDDAGDELDKIGDQIEKWIDDAMLDALQDKAMSFYRKNSDLINEAASSLSALTTNRDSYAVIQRLCGQAATKKHDAQTNKDMNTLMATSSMKTLVQKGADTDVAQSFSDEGSYTIRSMRLGAGAGGGSTMGIDGSLGFAWSIDKSGTKNELKFYITAGALLGMVEGAAINIAIELCSEELNKSSGPFLALQLEIELKCGGGVAFCWAVPTDKDGWSKIASMEPSSFIVRLGGGKKLDVAVCAGYSQIFV